MVLSGLLKPSSHNPPRRQPRASPQRASSTHSTDQSSPESASSANPQSDPYIHKEGHLAPIESEDPDLRELNNSLVALAAIFPDVQVEVFREMLSSFDEESRLAVVTETLLKHKMKWVRGRYRVAVKEAAQPESRRETQHGSKGNVPAEEKFRSAGYRKAVKSITYQEFKGLSRSTINAVLAEFNHSYTLARPTLVALSSKSWRFSLSSIFLRRKPISSSEVEHHPLVIWQSTGQGSIIPTLKATGSPELDKELFDSLIRPIQQRRLLELEEKDHTLALELNNTEAEKNDGLHDCECCFTSVTFEELSACDTGGHFICFQCVRRSVNEAVFGQGWQRNIDLDCGTLRCVAAMSDDCQGCIPQELVRRAFDEDKAGHVILILGVGMIPFLLPVFLVFSFLFLLVSSQQTFGDFAVTYLNSSIIRLRRKRLGLKFVCQSETCGRSSCISCSKAWNDIHICHESSLLALRTQVELAMSLAIKRTCPRCNTSFVKSSGCNKLTCVCGYQMCYVCRKDIGNGEGYRHFCEHFRPNGGRGCTECSKCDLYRCEDDEVVVKKAKEEAERQWMEKEGTVLGGDEKIRKVLEEKWKNDGEWWDVRWLQWKMPNWEQIFDSLIESVIE